MSYPNQLPDDVFLFGASCASYAKGLDWPMREWDRKGEAVCLLLNHGRTARQIKLLPREQGGGWSDLESDEVVDLNNGFVLDAEKVLPLKWEAEK